MLLSSQMTFQVYLTSPQEIHVYACEEKSHLNIRQVSSAGLGEKSSRNSREEGYQGRAEQQAYALSPHHHFLGARIGLFSLLTVILLSLCYVS